MILCNGRYFNSYAELWLVKRGEYAFKLNGVKNEN